MPGIRGFPQHSKRGSVNFNDFGSRVRGREVLDAFGCLWRFNISGLQGQVEASFEGLG